MQCNCGSETRLMEHEVKTLELAQEWYPDVKEIPIIVRRQVCNKCGRQMMMPYSNIRSI